MLEDDAFIEGTDANNLLVELAFGREVTTGKTQRFGVKSRDQKQGSAVTWVRMLVYQCLASELNFHALLLGSLTA